MLSQLDHGPLLASISAQAIPTISHGMSQNLSNTAWAWARLGIDDIPLLNAIAAAAIPRIRDFFKPQHLSTTAWAFSARVLKDQPLLDAISASAIANISSCE